MTLEPSNWRHFFRLGHASWGDERLRAAAQHARALPRFRVRAFPVGDGPRRARTPARSRNGAATGRRRAGSPDAIAAIAIRRSACTGCSASSASRRTMSTKRCASSIASRALAQPHRLYGREYHDETRGHARGACLLRVRRGSRGGRRFERRARGSIRITRPHISGLALALRATGAVARSRGQRGARRPRRSRRRSPRPVRSRPRSCSSQMPRGRRSGRRRVCSALRSLLDAAPAGFAGWTLPIEPLPRPTALNTKYLQPSRLGSPSARAKTPIHPISAFLSVSETRSGHHGRQRALSWVLHAGGYAG